MGLQMHRSIWKDAGRRFADLDLKRGVNACISGVGRVGCLGYTLSLNGRNRLGLVEKTETGDGVRPKMAKTTTKM